MSTEFLFILGLVGLYLYDSAQLRFYNEFFITRGFGKKFSYTSVQPNIHFAKKFLSFPDLFFPHHLQFHCQWQLQTQKDQTAQLNQDIEEIEKLSKILRPLQYSIFIVAMSTLVALPLAIIFEVGYVILAALSLLIYGLNLLNSLYIFVQRNTLQLSKKFLIHLLLDTLLCPPFALNSLKKISLNLKLKSDAIYLGHALFSPQHRADFDLELAKVIAQLKQQYPSSNKNYQALEQRELELKLSKTHSE